MRAAALLLLYLGSGRREQQGRLFLFLFFSFRAIHASCFRAISTMSSELPEGRRDMYVCMYACIYWMRWSVIDRRVSFVWCVPSDREGG